MLLQTTTAGWLAISQPAHARTAAQLATAWGGDWVAPVSPREEVIVGTLLHDIGWLDWEAAPTFNPETGLPHTFMELPIATHIGMWRRASMLALAFGRYPALLTSLHGTRLYGARDLSKLDPKDAMLVAGFLADERRRQAEWLTALAADSSTADAVADATLGRNSSNLALWDALSLAICGGIRSEREFHGVPTLGGALRTLRLRPGPDATTVALDPWPFAACEVVVSVEGRLIQRRVSDESMMRDDLLVAPWQSVVVTLTPV